MILVDPNIHSKKVWRVIRGGNESFVRNKFAKSAFRGVEFPNHRENSLETLTSLRLIRSLK